VSVAPALLRGRGRYERAIHGWSDNTHDDAFTHTVRIADGERTLELRVVATPSPDYAIRAARCGAEGDDAWECWQLDTAGWIDLPDSCFTYSDAGRRLFGTRPIATANQPQLYCARPGQAKVFERRKLMRLETRDGRLALFHSMHDNVHGFEVTYEIDAATGRIVKAEHVTPRLPYMGLCSEPQRRIAALVGETVDAGLRKRIQAHLGGPAGCAQLYDLTADLLKLLA
jgi:hypothetical protein